MCYNAVANTRAKLKYAKHRGGSPEDIAELERQLQILEEDLPTYHFVNAFAFPKLLGFTNDAPMQPQTLQWGLIPFWAKDDSIRKRGLNARCETIFTSGMFKASANKRRCLIYLDAFYEYHHFNKKAYPFRISMKNDDPLIMAGLWDEWSNKESGEVIRTCSIVTTKANPIMARIHNKPAASEEPRMPVILKKEKQDEWLLPDEEKDIEQQIMELTIPYPEEEIKYYTVRPLVGKAGSGNSPEAEEEFEYPELALLGF